jgi:ABC-2 type transport system ATP-binding protein
VVVDGQAAIETEGLTKTYGRQVAVDGLTLSVGHGEVFGFLGPNGAGKTTTLLMLLGLTEPTAGSARVLGFNPTREPIKVKRQVAYLQENMGFYRDLTARQSLSYIAALNGMTEAGSRPRVEAALEAVGLADEAQKRVAAFSRGMRQRLGLAEVLLRAPKVAFLDEPTLGLDPDATEKILGLIGQLATGGGMTVVLCSLQLRQVQRICTRIGIMIGGRMVATGTFEELSAAKLGVGAESWGLEEIYMRYFRESEG